MPRNRSNAYCCGAGGGRIWMETPKEDRFSDIRVAQAVETGAEVLATGCPYCVSNFEESALALEDEGAPVILQYWSGKFDEVLANPLALPR